MCFKKLHWRHPVTFQIVLGASVMSLILVVACSFWYCISVFICNSIFKLLLTDSKYRIVIENCNVFEVQLHEIASFVMSSPCYLLPYYRGHIELKAVFYQIKCSRAWICRFSVWFFKELFNIWELSFELLIGLYHCRNTFFVM